MAKIQIHEVRRIIFPLEMAVDAVLEFDREQGGQLAWGTLVNARIESDPEPGLRIEVRPEDASAPRERQYSLSAIAAAFIHYCRKVRIPIPRQATKRIAIVPEGLALTIEVTVEVARRHAWTSQPQTSRPGSSPEAEAQSSVTSPEALASSEAVASPEAEAESSAA
jgi:hypothetical protein